MVFLVDTNNCNKTVFLFCECFIWYYNVKVYDIDLCDMVCLVYLNNIWHNLVMLGAKASVHFILDQLFIIFLTHHGENLYVMWYFILNGLFVEWYHDMGIHYLVHVRCSLAARLNACWKYKQHHCDYECGVRKHGDKWWNIYDIMNAMAFKMIICLKTTSVPTINFEKYCWVSISQIVVQ